MPSFKSTSISFTGTNAQLNVTSGVTAGTALPNKALVLNISKDINGINSISSNNLNISNMNGVIQTASQPNIQTLGTLTNLNVLNNCALQGHGGINTSLILGNSLVTSNSTQLNYNTITTTGIAQPLKSLILDASRNINSINYITTNNIFATNLTLSGVLLTLSASQINYNTITTPGIAQSGTSLILNSLRNISNINSISLTNTISNNLTGLILISDQSNITSTGTLSSLAMSGNISGVNNIIMSNSISNALTVSATNLTGTVQTNAQPNITSVGTLLNLNVADGVNAISVNINNLTLSNIKITSSSNQLNYNNISTIGSTQPSSTIILNASSNINNINSLSSTNLISNNLTGIVQTIAQLNITSLGILTSLALSGAISGITNLSMSSALSGIIALSSANITGSIITSSQSLITSLGILNNLNVSGNIGCNTNNPLLAFEINNNIGQCLRLSYNSPIGNANNYSNIVLNNLGQLNILSTGNLVNLKSNVIIGNSNTSNIIQFSGVTGMSGNNMTVISEQLYNNNTSGNSELLLFKGNSITIPNRIRSRAGQHIFQTYTATEDYSTLADNNTRLSISNSGFIGINTSSPNRNLEINGGTNTYSLRLNYNATSILTDLGTDNTGNLNILPYNNNTNFGSSIDTSQSIIIGSNNTTSTNGIITLGTNSGICSLNAGLNTTTESSADFVISNYGQSISTSSRKFILKSSGNLGIGTTTPFRLMELSDPNGNCLRLSYNAPTGSATTYCDQTISSTGVTTFSINGTNPAFIFSGGNIAGTIGTSLQSNITSVGTLTSLVLNGQVTGVTNISMSGILSGLSSVSSTLISGSISTPGQSNITSLGSLTTLNVAGNTKLSVVTSTAQDILHLENNINSFVGIQIQNNSSVPTTSGCKISFTGFNSTNTNYELARISSITIDSGLQTNTLYQYGALAFSTRKLSTTSGATEFMRLTNNGYLGIGTTTPSYYLEVSGTSRSTQLLSGTSTDTSSTRIISALNSNLVIGNKNCISIGQNASSSNQGDLSFNYIGAGSTGNYLGLGTFGNSTLAVLGNGYVGIGTTTPAYNLDISGTSRTTNLILQSGTITGVNSIATSAMTVNGQSIVGVSPYISGITPGTATASTILVLDSNRNISNINYLTTNYLYGSIQTATQPNITSVGTLTSLVLSGSITGVTGLVVSGTANISTISTGNITLSGSIYQPSQTPVYQGNWPQGGYWGIGNDPSIASTIKMGTIGSSNASTFSGYASLSAQNIYTQGYAGIGTNSPSYLLDVSGINTTYIPDSYRSYTAGSNSGLYGAGSFGTSYVSARFQGRILVANEMDIASDRRIKTDIYDLTDDLCKSFIQKTTPVHFKYNNTVDDQSHYGYIAQDVLKAGFADLVTPYPHDEIEETTDDDGFVSPKDTLFALCLDEIVPILSKNIKMLYKENLELELENDKMTTMVNKLYERYNKLISV